MNETFQIDQYIRGQLSPGDMLVMDARVIVDDEFATKVEWQRRTYQVIRQYARKELKTEIEKIHYKLFTESRYEWFRTQVKKICGKS